MRKRTIILLILGLSILFALIYSVGTKDIIETLSEAKKEYILLGISLFVLSLFVKCTRWYMLLKDAYPNLGYKKLLAPFLFGYGLSASLPAKSGDLARLGVKKHYLDINIGDSAAALFTYRIIDYIFTLSFIAFSFFFLLDQYVGVSDKIRASWFGLVFIFISLAILALVVGSKKSGSKIVEYIRKLVEKLMPSLLSKYDQYVQEEADRFYARLNTIKKSRIVIPSVILITCIRWIIEIFAVYFFMLALNIDLSIVVLGLALFISTIVGILTFVPLGIGTGNVTSYQIFKSAGLAEAKALSLSILFIIGPIISLIAGMCAFFYLTLDEKKNKKYKDTKINHANV